jgi:hypothetical protein
MRIAVNQLFTDAKAFRDLAEMFENPGFDNQQLIGVLLVRQAGIDQGQRFTKRWRTQRQNRFQ